MMTIPMIHDPEPTIQDVLTVMNQFSTHVDEEFANVKVELTTIKSMMVTKPYLDDKLADLKAEFTGLVRKEDTKVSTIVSKLHTKNVFSDSDVQSINQIQVFAKRPTV